MQGEIAMTHAPVEPFAWSGGFRSLEDEHDSRIDDVDGIVPAWLRGTLFRTARAGISSTASGFPTGSTATA